MGLCRTISLTLCLFLIIGCLVPYENTLESEQLKNPPEQVARHGLIWLFSGLVGLPWETAPAYRAFRDRGLEREYQFFQWNRPPGDFMGHLKDIAGNEADTAEAAAHIAAYRRQYPSAPIDLVGYSAGGYLALRVVEQLPAEVRVRNIILAQPDISPTYPLTAALQHVDGQIVCFYSRRDWFVSGVFTTSVGTMDGLHTASAGNVGLDLPVAVPDPGLRAKVQLIPWAPSWGQAGHSGGHVQIHRYEWNYQIVAPYLLGDGGSEAP